MTISREEIIHLQWQKRRWKRHLQSKTFEDVEVGIVKMAIVCIEIEKYR